MQRDESITQGMVNAFVSLLALTLLFTLPGIISEALDLHLAAIKAPQPSAELLRGIASLGGAMVLAYVVQAAWLVRESAPQDDQGKVVGFITGIGIAGFCGVVLALVLAEHRAAGHDNAIDTIGWAWIWASQGALAGVVLFQPLFVFQLLSGSKEDEDDADRPSVAQSGEASH